MFGTEADREAIVPRTPWRPIGLWCEMDRMLDDLGFERVDLRFPSFELVAGGSGRVPAVDITDAGDKYLVQAELPGIAKENVEVEIADGSLEIRGRMEEKKEEKGEGYVRRERGRMSFHRRIPIYEDVDEEGIEARMKDGVLEITLPKAKKAEEPRKKVEVK